MRKWRRWISVIMFIVMLTTMIPSGAMAAEAPTGATSEIAAVEEPQDEMTEETIEETAPASEEDGSDDAMAEEQEAPANEEENKEAAAEDAFEGTSVSDTDEAAEESQEEESQAADTSSTSEVAAEEESENSEDSATAETGSEAAPEGMTSIEEAAEEEPEKNEKMGAGSPIDLAANNRIKNLVFKRKGTDESEWSTISATNKAKKGDEVQIIITYEIENGVLSDDNNVAIYNLPEGIVLPETLEDDTTGQGGAVVGRIKAENQSDDHILVTLTYNKSATTGLALEGEFTINGKLDFTYPDIPGRFVFPGAGGDFQIEIESWHEHDIKVVKNGSGTAKDIEYRESDGASIAHYELIVSTEKGTLDKVDVTDVVTLSGDKTNFKFSYDQNSLTVKDSAGRNVALTADQVKFEAAKFTITGLPQLNAGEKYTITYDAVIEQRNKGVEEDGTVTSKLNSGMTVENKVTAESGTDNWNASHTLKIYPEIVKTSSNTDLNYTWTIKINQNKSHSLDGCTFIDTMSGGMYATSNVTIKGASQTKTLTLNLSEKPTTFSYAFKASEWGNDIDKQFTITFNANSAGAVGEYSNNAYIMVGNNEYNHKRVFVGEPAKTEKKTGGWVYLEDYDGYTLGMQWQLVTMRLPNTMKAGTSHTYEDYLYQPIYNVDLESISANGTTLHYTYCDEIYRALDGNIKLTTTDGYYKFESSSSTTCSYSELDKTYTPNSNAVTFKLTGYDASGRAYDIVSNKNDRTIKITRFRITVTANEDLTISKASLGSKSYYSYFYYGPENADAVVNSPDAVRFYNRLRSVSNTEWSSSAYQGWRLGMDREKESKYTIEEDGKEYIDYTAVLHWDLINNKGGEVVFTDQRSFGDEYGGGLGTYVEGSAKAVLYNNVDLASGHAIVKDMEQAGYFTVDSSKDDEGTLLFKFDMSGTNAYDSTAKRVKITYRIRIDEDEWWKNHKFKIYHNVIADNHGHSAEEDTEVSKDSDVLNKEGIQQYAPNSQGIEEPTGRIEYSIEINKGKADLDPEKDDIVLFDTMDNKYAEFDYNSVRLYDLETDRELAKTWDYDPDKKELAVYLKDKVAYKLVYEYTVNLKNITSSTVLNNSAELCGFVEKNKVEPHTLDIGSVVTSRDITFTKTDESNDDIKIKGAKFDLEKYNTANSSWEKVGSQGYETAENGNIHFDIIHMHLESNVAYRLIETEAAPGYSDKTQSGETVAFYFVIASQDRDEAAENAAASVFPEGANQKFFDYYGGTAVIRNRKIETGDLTVSKTVKNGGDSDNSKDFNFKVTLNDTSITGKYGDMTFSGGVATFTLKNGESATATDLPVGIRYTVVEIDSTGYKVTKTGDTGEITTTKSEAKFTNTPDTTKLSVTKVWNDKDDQDGFRPDSVEIVLVADGTETDNTLTLSEENLWTGEFTNLPKYNGNKEIVYTVSETAPAEYEVAITGTAATGFTVTNTHEPILIDILVEKIWDDNNNQDAIRPTSIQVKLTAGGKQVGDVITLNKGNGWKHTWEKQPKYSAGKEIVYKVDEVSVPAGYTKVVSGNTKTGYKITNTHGEDKTKVSVKKVWDDADDQDGVRPESVTVQLKADGIAKGEAVTLSEDNDWFYEWTGLTKNNAGQAIVYTVEETAVPKYNTPTYDVEVEKDDAGNVIGYAYTVTNSRETDKVKASVRKVWDDSNNQDGIRPTEIKVQLKADGENLGTEVTLNEANGWAYSWIGLEKNKAAGEAIEYTVDEVEVPAGYTKTVDADPDKAADVAYGYVINNYHGPDVKRVKVTKVWDDNDDQDGMRPASIGAQLLANGEEALPDGTELPKVTLSEANSWTYTWDKLPVNWEGEEITYTVEERDVPDTYPDRDVKRTVAEDGTIEFTFTNTRRLNVTEIEVRKEWKDSDNQDGKRPGSLKVQLLANGTKIEEVELSEENGWSYKWENLPTNEPKGKKIIYRVTETTPDDYQPSVEMSEKTVGTIPDIHMTTSVKITLTNSYTPDKTSVSVEKIWNDADDQDGIRPESITVKLTADAGPVKTAGGLTVTLPKEDGSWTHTWEDLDKMAGGKDIVYSVDEVEVPDGYEKTVTPNADKTSYTITNKHTPETIDIDVEKVWDDADDMDKVRPENVTVALMADGAAVREAATLSEDNEWYAEWTDLPRYKDHGTEIKYTVEETPVDGYKTSYDFVKNETDGKLTGYSYTVTNTHDERPVSVRKVDIANQKELPGATLQVIDGEGTVFEEWISTEEDHVVYGLTPDTEYTLRETVQPDGYTIATDIRFTVDKDGKVSAGESVTEDNVLLVEDTKTKVHISKVDIVTEKELPGATLQVLDGEGNVVELKDGEGNTVDKLEWVSTEEDRVIEGLRAGVEYTLRETIAPDGYTITSDTTFTIDDNNNVTSNGTVTTAEDGTPVIVVKDDMTKVNISKVDITGEEELQGATLQILDSEENVVVIKDRNGEDVTLEWVSEKEPKYIEGLLTGTEYILREITAPDGYTIATDVRFSIDMEGNVTSSGKINESGVLLIEDEPTKVKVSKTDITGEEELQGATLQILDSEGNIVEIKDNDGNVTEKLEWVSTKEPKYIEGLLTGVEYTLRETIAPDGYTIATDTTFTIDETGKVTSSGSISIDEEGVTTMVVNDDITKVKISKVEIGAGEELPGATLQILDAEGNVVEIKDNDGNVIETCEWVSGTEPKYIEGLPTGVEYTLRETIAPDGYTITSDTKFTIDEKGVITSSGTTSKDEDGVTILVVEDDKTHITVSKVDTGAGEELPGALIQIIDEDGNVVEEWTSTTEPHKIDGLLTGKTYILREKVAPLGYTLTSDTTFTIDEYGKVTSTGTVNKEGMLVIEDTITEVFILKVDAKTGKGLAGAKLQVLDDNGTVCEEWTSTTESHRIAGLYTGVTYTLHEVTAPKGYKVAKDVTFKIDEYGKVSGETVKDGVVIMKDEQNPPPKNKTGDDANVTLWALLMALAGSALGGTFWFRRKRRV